MRAFEFIIENQSQNEYEFQMQGFGDDANFMVSKDEHDNVILHGYDLDVSYRRIDTGKKVREGQFDFVYQLTGDDEGNMEITPRITAVNATIEYDDDEAHDSINEVVWQFKEEYGDTWGSIIGKLDPEEGGIEINTDDNFEFDEDANDWKKDKIKIEIPGEYGDFYLSYMKNHLILHGVECPSFAWTDRDGDGHEGEFSFDYDIDADAILDIEYPDREDQGLYVYDEDNAFHDDIREILQSFRNHYDDTAISRFKAKLEPEEGGIEVGSQDDWFDESSNIPFAGKAVGHKEGRKGQWRNKGPSAKRPARPGDLVGGGM